MNEFEQTLLDTIHDLESQGISLTEEEVAIELILEERPDVLVTMSFVDKAVVDSMQEANELIGRMMH